MKEELGELIGHVELRVESRDEGTQNPTRDRVSQVSLRCDMNQVWYNIRRSKNSCRTADGEVDFEITATAFVKSAYNAVVIRVDGDTFVMEVKSC